MEKNDRKGHRFHNHKSSIQKNNPSANRKTKDLDLSVFILCPLKIWLGEGDGEKLLCKLQPNREVSKTTEKKKDGEN